jgi:hypothetical protein
LSPGCRLAPGFSHPYFYYFYNHLFEDSPVWLGGFMHPLVQSYVQWDWSLLSKVVAIAPNYLLCWIVYNGGICFVWWLLPLFHQYTIYLRIQIDTGMNLVITKPVVVLGPYRGNCYLFSQMICFDCWDFEEPSNTYKQVCHPHDNDHI